MFEEGVRVEPSGRVQVERGPVSMVLSARANGLPAPHACLEAVIGLDDALAELGAQRELLSLPWPELPAFAGLTPLARCMHEAARATQHPEMTSLCAVAGAVSDRMADTVAAVLANVPDMVVTVNNGGDIALRLGENASVRVGLVPAIGAAGADESVELRAADGIFGVATSGLGARGMTRGVADSVTVFAPDAALADALATRMANASRIESPRVHRVLAGTLRPGCDIANLDITTGVDPLTPEERALALENVRTAAQPLLASGVLLALRAVVQGEILWIPGVLADSIRTLN